MVKYNERFFRLVKCVFNRQNRTAHLIFACVDNFEPEIPQHEQRIMRQLFDSTGEEFKVEFEYVMPKRQTLSSEEASAQMQELADFAKTLPGAQKIDKSLAVHKIEYHCGAPTKIRPIKIKYLRNQTDPQVTGGNMNFITKREYVRDGVTKEYYTFIIDDGEGRLNCVYFPSAKTRGKFTQLTNRDVVTVVGVKDKRGDRENFRVSGFSLCEWIEKKKPEK